MFAIKQLHQNAYLQIKGRAILIFLLLAELSLAGCHHQATGNGPRIVRVGYYGGTCEAPIFVAYEKGIFQQNGLKVELVKLNSTTLKLALDSGKVDALQVTPGEFKSMEQGLDIVLVDGIHTGCIRAVAQPSASIHSVADLRGKAIGTDAMGGVPMTLLSMEMLQHGMNPATDVTWKIYPSPQLSQALDKKQVDAFASFDPFPAMAVRDGKGIEFFNNGKTKPYAEQFCCYLGVNGKVARNEPQLTKLLAKSFAEAGAWVAAHPHEAAEIAISKGYTGGGIPLNTTLLSEYKYFSNPQLAQKSFLYYLNGMKKLGMLDSTTNVDAFAAHSFVDVTATR